MAEVVVAFSQELLRHQLRNFSQPLGSEKQYIYIYIYTPSNITPNKKLNNQIKRL